ncbi:MAG TPA: methylmalonyl-CoA mutase family protein, partial [Gemmatimonadaceae bacterium]|nr:methylmalonyl-CoA mutase family protein [Gemmatimonadaceae bacterium]
PTGGAAAIEEATDRIERESVALLDRIDALGGTLAAIEAGFIQREIQDAAYRAQQQIDSGASVVVGVNRYQDSDTDPPQPRRAEAPEARRRIETLRIDPALEQQQVERVRQLRAARDTSRWNAAIDAVRAAARSPTNLVPPIIAAVEARATVGEIADAMRDVFGEHRETDA